MFGIHGSFRRSAALLFAIGVSFEAGAAMLSLSTHSSDETDAALLLATFDFSVSGSVLTLSVTNDTGGANGFNINEVYFNAGASLAGLTLNPAVTGWTLQTDVAANGFGVFRFGLIDGVGEMNQNTIMPGETQVFMFDMSGTAAEIDFLSHMSTIPPGDNPMIAAAKFVSGPDDDSAFGATNLPGPGGAVVIGCIGLALARRRR